MVFYGGAISEGKMATDQLFLLEISNFDYVANCVVVTVQGKTPGTRYGHSIVLCKPHLIIYGGNSSTELLSDVWILNIEKRPFAWILVEPTGTIKPSP